MPLIEWSENFSVNIPSIDEQHKKIVHMVNELHEAMITDKGNSVLGKIFGELIQYTKTHFSYEEKLFQTYGYPEAEDHKQSHDALTSKTMALQKDFETGSTTIMFEVSDFLKSWLTNHIQGQDKKYAPFLSSKGVT
ncbi:MAG: bacteriohemerythrin [Candidatus Omnitrophica bacterium]|nr:bacteriohemerythrin [Candidatus Omnitrophota bacterium]